MTTIYMLMYVDFRYRRGWWVPKVDYTESQPEADE